MAQTPSLQSQLNIRTDSCHFRQDSHGNLVLSHSPTFPLEVPVLTPTLVASAPENSQGMPGQCVMGEEEVKGEPEIATPVETSPLQKRGIMPSSEFKSVLQDEAECRAAYPLNPEVVATPSFNEQSPPGFLVVETLTLATNTIKTGKS